MEQQAFVSPVALAQRRLWLVHQVEAERTLYNVASSSAIDGPLDAALLRRALAFVLDRHEALRTSFALMDGEPVQLVSPAAEAALPVVDLAAVPAGRRATEVRRIIAAEWARRFDLVWPEGNSLLRARLLRLGPAEHRLALVIHHIVSDGWSMGILRRELAAAYAAFARGEDPDLEELPIQYADFAEWQLERLGPEAEAEHVAFWRERLAGAPALLELPLDRPRGSRPASGGIHPVALPAGVTRRLTALAAAERTMPFAALAALTALLLHRHSGQDDLVLGWPAAGRDRPELEGLIGLFVNTLVLRVRFAPATSFRELLRAVGAELASGLAHQELPFDRLVEELSPERIPGANPLFQAMVVFQHAGEEPAPAEPGAARFRTEGTDLDLELAAGLFDLTLEMGLEEGALRGRFEYRADLFDRSTVARLADHLRHLAEDAVRRPDAPVERLDLHGAAERHALLVEWARPATGAREARERTFLEGWAAVAASRPEAAALEGPEGSTRHAELAERARRVARGLRRRGVGRGDVVALFFERSPEAVVAMLGVLEAGAAYLPLDPAYPEERRAFMLEDSGARLVLDGPELAELLAEPVPETTETLPAGPDPDDPAYLIYTSGSTGTPKGVQVCHRNLLFAARALAERYRIGATARLLQIAPLSFDASVAEIFPTLLAGGTLCFGRADDLLPGPALAELLRDRAVSHLTLVPSALAAMPEAAELPDLRILVVAGEACPAELAGRWRRGRTLINAYGPTEATICAAAGDVAAEGSAGSDRSSPPIGRPVTGSRVHVVDPEMNPAPVGVPGELVIGGRGVARGYRNRPRLTAERFVPDPWSDPAADPGGESAGARLYRSGDLAAWRPDGRLAFLGRVDRQVKVRGFRIEPGEIEAVLERHPDVHDSVVGAVVDPRRRGDDPAAPAVLAAWVVPRGGTAEAAVRPEELRRFLVARLPDHMVPTAYALLDSLPLTPAGKVDRRALPEPAGGASAPGAPAPPRTPVEELLVEIWADALGLDTLGVDQDFFSLGGHSLLATRVVGRVCKALEVDLPVSALFRAPTVAGLAERIAELGRWAPAGEALPPLEPVTGPIPETPEAPEGEETGARDGGRKLPLSFAQQRLWLLDRLEPGSPLYNVPMVFRISNLDRAALAGGVSDLVARHESLRTRFAERGDRPVQSIAPPPPPGSVPLPVVDLSALPEEPRRAEAWRLAAAEARRPFDLAARCREGLGEAAPGLLRTLLLTLEPDGEAAGHRLLATVHHAVFDGWSAGVFAEELAVLAGRRAEVGGGDGSAAPADLPPLPIQYGDYAVWQRRILSDRVVERELAFWR
ncbi:MAG: amino acid adenylation domain-containing protein, partial [Acidobacteriota bacterium]